jgi:SMI1 / KNR4 family (SUKH-1)
MNEQLNRISSKIVTLKNTDKDLTLFGSSHHQYKLNEIISTEEITKFEQQYGITLPKDYVGFVTTLGNGGAGPYYGLEPFGNSLFADLDNKSMDTLLNPSKPFLHTVPWNLEFSTLFDHEINAEEYENEYVKFEEQYFDKEQMNGAIAICNCGCASSINLIVHGQEYGNIWTDDRAGGMGILPSFELGNKDKISFLDWYELWLDNSMALLRN